MEATDEVPKPTVLASEPNVPGDTPATPAASSSGAGSGASSSGKSGKADAAKIRERLNKLRSKRAESAAASSGEEGGGSGPGDDAPLLTAGSSDSFTPSRTPSTNDRRKLLQKMRQQSRAGTDGDGDLASSGTSLKRSFSRSSKSRRLNRSNTKRSSLDLEEGTDYDEGEDTGDGEGDAEEEDYDELFQPLMTVEPAEFMYPLDFMPKRRALENHLQRVVLTPAGSHTVETLYDWSYASCGDYCCSCSCCGDDCSCCQTQQSKPSMMPSSSSSFCGSKDANTFHEFEFLISRDNYKYTEWLAQQRIGAPELMRLFELLQQEKFQPPSLRSASVAADGNTAAAAIGTESTAADANTTAAGSGFTSIRTIIGPSGGRGASGTGKSHSSKWALDIDLDLEMGFFNRDIVVEDGVYNGTPPLLASLLLRGEQVSPAIAHFTAAQFLPSRVTQRILRDLKLGLINESLRRHWKTIMHGGVVDGNLDTHETETAPHGILTHSGSGQTAAALRRSRTGGGVQFALGDSTTTTDAAARTGDEGALGTVTEQPGAEDENPEGTGGDADADAEGGGDLETGTGTGADNDENDDGDAAEGDADDDDADDDDDDDADNTHRRGRNKRKRINAKRGTAAAAAALIREVPAEARLLTNLDSSPMLQVLESPVLSSITQPSVPPQQMLYGGQLGQWGAEHNPADRLGPLALGWSGRRGGQRAVFRLHLHQLVVTDHPLMSIEERKLVQLKETYAQYRSLFEQKVLEYLTQRLLSLTTQLMNMVEVPKHEYSEDELLALRGIYRDVIETLPALNELNYAVDRLTTNIYEGWRELLELRRRQGCVNTTADLSVRRVKSNLLYGDSNSNSTDVSPSQASANDDGHIGHNDNDDGDARRGATKRSTHRRSNAGNKKISWEHLKTNLEKVPALMKQAQVVLFPDEEDEEEDGSVTGSVAGSTGARRVVSSGGSVTTPRENSNAYAGQQASLRHKEHQILKHAQLDKIISGVTLAVQELVDNRGVIPQFALRMTEDGALTPDNQLPPDEAKRRAQLNHIRVKAVLRMNGRVVTSTDYYAFHASSMSVDFNKYFEFRVLHQPSDVSLVLYSNKADAWGPIQDSHLATISIPVPGRNSGDAGGAGGAGGGATPATHGSSHQHMAHSYVPTTGWYTFSSAIPTQGFFRSSWIMAQPAEPHLLQRRTEGAVLCTAEYDVSTQETIGGSSTWQYEGVRTDDLAVLPVPRSTGRAVSVRSKGGVTGGAGSRSATNGINDFTKENDFQVLLPEFDDLDLNDPRNDYLLYLKSKRSVSENKILFRLTGSDYTAPFHGAEGRSFANYVHFKECARFKLLRLRNLKPYLFQSPIPLSDTDIRSNDVYKNIFIKELHESPLSIRGGTIAEEDEIESTNKLTGKESVNVAKVTNFLQRVRNSQTALTRKKKKKHLLTSSVVVETDYFAPSEAQELPNLLGRKRSLHPRPKHRTAHSMQVDRCDLLVQIVGAKNIPLRSEFDNVGGLSTKRSSANIKSARLTAESAREGGGAADGDVPAAGGAVSAIEEPVVSEYMLDEAKAKEKKRARTFVEVKFQEHVDATTVFDGSTPLWKQTLSLPFRAPQGDFTPASLEQVRDNVYFTLFDEVIEDDSNRGGLLEGENPIRVEKRYLGSFSIPFETIYREGRIEGVFRVDTPLINFGYDQNPSSATRRQQARDTMFVGEGGAAAAGAAASSGEAGAAAASQHDPGAADGVSSRSQRPHTSWWFILLDFIDYLSDAGTTLLAPKEPPDGLLYVAEHIHPETLTEFSFFAADEQATYAKVLITLEPLLVSTPNITQEISVSNTVREDRTIASYARGWLAAVKDVSVHTDKRDYLLFGTNSSGQNVLICRYLTPLEPPKGFKSRRACVHLVANIPFMKDAQSFIGEMDLWCTCFQFWEIGAGDEEEHAVMLFNYLCYLERQDQKNAVAFGSGISSGSGYPSKEAVAQETVFLATGTAVPEGDTVYVILRDNRRHSPTTGSAEDYLIINPCTGNIYCALDPNCPLRDIHTLATPYNIWANIQDDLRPAELNYDILNSSKWRPLFGSRLPPPSGGLSSIQTPIDYIDSSPGYAVEVEKALFQAIRNSIRRWRSKRHRSTTTFHPDACSVMHELLPKLENWKRSGNPDTFMDADEAARGALMGQEAALPALQGGVKERMRNLLRTRTLKGFPVNMPFTDVDEVLNKVRTWSIHEAKHPEVQFVMAVRAFPLYNNILSLWIFLGTLETNPL